MSSHVLGQGKFLDNFWNKSRLHFIGTWRERYEALLAALETEMKEGLEKETKERVDMERNGMQKRQKRKRKFSDREKLLKEGPAVVASDGTKVILHVDMDCFFASVSLRAKPELKDSPVVITSNESGPASEVSCANYPARSFGIKAGMSLSRARERCSEVISLPYEFEEYMKVAEGMYRALFNLSPFVNGLSCDEAFVDITHLVLLCTDAVDRKTTAMKLAKKLQERIFSKTEGCPASIGIGENMLLAKVATRKAKPNGVFAIDMSNEDDQTFFGQLDIKEIPQIGYSSSKTIREVLQSNTCAELQSVSIAKLKEVFGPKKGEMIYKHCRGIDLREWVHDGIKQRQSIGAQSSWGVRMTSEEEVSEFLQRLAKEVVERMSASATVVGKGARRITLTVWRAKPNADPHKRKGMLGHGQCDILSRSVSLGQGVNKVDQVFKSAHQLYRKTSVEPHQVRGFGISCSNFEVATKTGSGISAWFGQGKTCNTSISRITKEVDDGEIHVGSQIESKEHDQSEQLGFPVEKKDLDDQSETESLVNEENFVEVGDSGQEDVAVPFATVRDSPSGPESSVRQNAGRNLELPLRYAAFESVKQDLDRCFSKALIGFMSDSQLSCTNRWTRFCPGNPCASPLCLMKQSISDICEIIMQHCSSLNSKEDSYELVLSLRTYSQYQWPNHHSYFSDCCSQILADLLSDGAM